MEISRKVQTMFCRQHGAPQKQEVVSYFNCFTIYKHFVPVRMHSEESILFYATSSPVSSDADHVVTKSVGFIDLIFKDNFCSLKIILNCHEIHHIQ